MLRSEAECLEHPYQSRPNLVTELMSHPVRRQDGSTLSDGFSVLPLYGRHATNEKNYYLKDRVIAASFLLILFISEPRQKSPLGYPTL